MLDVFEKFAVNVDTELNGVWKDFYGAKVLIARSGNKKFNEALSAAYEQNQEELSKGGDAANALAEKLMLGVLADTLVLGWENMGFKKKILPYSRENVIMLLGQKELHDFRFELLSLADDVENFRLKQEEEQTKN